MGHTLATIEPFVGRIDGVTLAALAEAMHALAGAAGHVVTVRGPMGHGRKEIPLRVMFTATEVSVTSVRRNAEGRNERVTIEGAAVIAAYAGFVIEVGKKVG